MNFAFYIARRSSLSHDGQKNSPAIKVAIIAVALSVAVMLAAISIVLGFKEQIIDKISGFNSHITLYKTTSNDAADSMDDSLTTLTPTLLGILNDEEYVTDVDLELSVPAVLKTDSDFKGIYLRGNSSDIQNNFIKNNIVSGVYPDYSKEENNDKVVISDKVAKTLNLKAGDKIPTYFISSQIKVRPLIVAGIFNTHFEFYDDLFAYASISMLQKVNDISSENKGSTIRVMTDDFSRLDEYTFRLNQRLVRAYTGNELFVTYHIDNALNQSASHLAWLALLDTNVMVILILMTLVACVTLISGMLILIIDKVSLIGILRSLGTSSANIRRLFIFLAMRIAFLGLIIGNVVMLALLYAEKIWHFIPLDAESYYINFVPVKIDWMSILLLNVGIIIIVFLTLLLPSMYASRISPTEAMRYKE
jgi:lipoprotein-releasing system permease protein